MNGKERLTAALEGRPTDRVPLQLLFYQGYIAHCAGRELWEFEYGTAQDQFDMVLASARRHPANDGIWTQTGMNRYPVPNQRVQFIDGKPWAMFDDGRRKLLTDSSANTQWNRSPEEVRAGYERRRVRTVADVSRRVPEPVPAAELVADASHQTLRRLAGTIGDSTFLWVNFSSLFSGAAEYLGGPAEAWMATHDSPDLVAAVLERCSRQYLEYIEAAARAGGHGLWNCFMNEGANILPPATWRELIKPHVAAHIARAHELGLKHVAWFLDDCRPLVQDLLEIDVDGLATEPPRVGYDCTPGDLRQLAGSNPLCIFGWFKERDLLAADRAALRQTLQCQAAAAGSGAPFVVSTPGLTGEVDAGVVDAIIEEALAL